MAETLPELLGRVRRKRRHHQHQRLDRFTDHGQRLDALGRCDGGDGVLTG